MTDVAYDAATPIAPALIKAHSGVAICRYIKKTLPNNYDLTKAELAGYKAVGLGVGYIAEQNSDDAWSKTPQYWSDYGKYMTDRLHSFGVDLTGVNLIAASDTVVSTANIPKVMRNLEAFATAIAPAGAGMIAYAQTQIIDLLVIEEISPVGCKHWLPSAIGWSGGAYHNQDGTWNWAKYLAYPHAGAVQRVGLTPILGTDINTLVDLKSMRLDFPPDSPYAPEDDMAGGLTDQEHNWLMQIDNAIFTGGTSMTDDGKAVQQSLKEIHDLLRTPVATPAQIAAAVVAALPPTGGASYTLDQLAEVFRKVLDGATVGQSTISAIGA